MSCWRGSWNEGGVPRVEIETKTSEMAKCECCERFLAAHVHMKTSEMIAFPNIDEIHVRSQLPSTQNNDNNGELNVSKACDGREHHKKEAEIIVSCEHH